MLVTSTPPSYLKSFKTPLYVSLITNHALDSFQSFFREKYQTSDLTNTINVFLEKGKTRLIVGHISYSRGFQVAFVARICISMYLCFHKYYVVLLIWVSDRDT